MKYSKEEKERAKKTALEFLREGEESPSPARKYRAPNSWKGWFRKEGLSGDHALEEAKRIQRAGAHENPWVDQ